MLNTSIWDRDALWAKAKLFFERAFNLEPEDSAFGLWCSLGLESLARSAVAQVHPLLLAEGDKEHKYLLHAFNSSERAPRSISAVLVFTLCNQLCEGFTKSELKASLALLNRRNSELHSAESAFLQYPVGVWLADFYRICDVLSKAQKQTLEDLFGPNMAATARAMINQNGESLRGKVSASMAAHKSVFLSKPVDERKVCIKEAGTEVDKLASQGSHRVTCPACGAPAVVRGEPVGGESITHEDGDVIVRQSMIPNSFKCLSCGLALNGFSELAAAGVGNPYTHRETQDVSSYYGLIDPNSEDLEPYLREYFSDSSHSWDNE